MSETAAQAERLYVGDVEVTRVQGMKLEPGDVLVVESPMPLSLDQAEHVRAIVLEHFPGFKVLVFSGGCTLSTYRPVKE